MRVGDVLVPSIGDRLRAFTVVGKSEAPLVFASSLIRVRVDAALAAPEDVVAFLQSDAARSAAPMLSTAGTIQKLLVSNLRSLPVLLPQPGTKPARSAVRTVVTAAGETARRLKDEILPLLAKLDSPDAGPTAVIEVANELRRLASKLAPPPLSERVRETYPTPLALSYARFLDSRFNVYEQALRLRDVFEAAAYFVYHAILADAAWRLEPAAYYITDPQIRKGHLGASMAYKLDFVEAVLACAEKRGKRELFMPDLTIDVVANAKTLQEEYRNRLSHTAAATEAQQERVIKEFAPRAEAILNALAFVSKYRLARVVAFYYRGGRMWRRMELYRGTSPVRDEAPVEGAEPDRADCDHIVLLSDDDEILDLHPMYQLVTNTQTHDESHLCWLKHKKGENLVGESVMGSIEVSLGNASEMSAIMARLQRSMN